MSIIDETNWESFEHLLKIHDWYYSYSDDHRVWQRGQTAEDTLQRRFRSLKEVDAPRAQALYDKYKKGRL